MFPHHRPEIFSKYCASSTSSFVPPSVPFKLSDGNSETERV